MRKPSRILSEGCCKILLLLCLAPKYTFSITTCDNQQSKNNLIVVVLLNLHDESSNCSKVNLRGLQQQAIIEKTVAEINSNVLLGEPMHMTANVIDTCSIQKDQGVNAALRSLVSSNQTCLNPPLLLGFVGPDNLEQLVAVHQVTSSLQKFHVLPFAMVASPTDEHVMDSSVLYVGNCRTSIRSKIILAVLNQIKWKSVYVVMAEKHNLNQNASISATLQYLLGEVDRVCVTGVLKIPKDLPKNNSLYDDLIRDYEKSGAEGIVVIAENPVEIKPLLISMKSQSQTGASPKPGFLLYMNQVGLKSWELPLNYSIVTLIESSYDMLGVNWDELLQNNPLTSKYYYQHEMDYKRNAFDDVLDASAIAFHYTIKLYWNAAKYARNIKCKLGMLTASNGGGICDDMYKITSTEWKAFMYKGAYHDVLTMKKVSLQMNVPISVKMFLTDAITNTPRLIGRVTDSGIAELHVNLATIFTKTTSGNVNLPKKCISPLIGGFGGGINDIIGGRKIPEIFTGLDEDSSILANVMAYGRSLFRLDDSVLEKTPYINLIALASIAVIVFLTCLSLVVKCVYETFKVQSEEERQQSINRGRNNRNLSLAST